VVDPLGLGTGDTLGDGVREGVLFGDRRGRGNSWASSSSSIGEERSRWRESRMSGERSSDVVEISDEVDASRWRVYGQRSASAKEDVAGEGGKKTSSLEKSIDFRRLSTSSTVSANVDVPPILGEADASAWAATSSSRSRASFTPKAREEKSFTGLE